MKQEIILEVNMAEGSDLLCVTWRTLSGLKVGVPK